MRSRAHPELELVTQDLSITTFRYVPADLRPAIGDAERRGVSRHAERGAARRLQRGGEVFVSNAVVRGRYAAARLHRQLPHRARPTSRRCRRSSCATAGGSTASCVRRRCADVACRLSTQACGASALVWRRALESRWRVESSGSAASLPPGYSDDHGTTADSGAGSATRFSRQPGCRTAAVADAPARRPDRPGCARSRRAGAPAAGRPRSCRAAPPRARRCRRRRRVSAALVWLRVMVVKSVVAHLDRHRARAAAPCARASAASSRAISSISRADASRSVRSCAYVFSVPRRLRLAVRLRPADRRRRRRAAAASRP